MVSNYSPILSEASPSNTIRKETSSNLRFDHNASENTFITNYKNLSLNDKLSIIQRNSSEVEVPPEISNAEILQTSSAPSDFSILLSNLSDTDSNTSNYIISNETNGVLNIPDTKNKKNIYSPYFKITPSKDISNLIITSNGRTFTYADLTAGNHYILKDINFEASLNIRIIYSDNTEASKTLTFKKVKPETSVDNPLASSKVSNINNIHNLIIPSNGYSMDYNKIRLFIHDETMALGNSFSQDSKHIKINLNNLLVNKPKPNTNNSISTTIFTVDKYGYVHSDTKKFDYDTLSPTLEFGTFSNGKFKASKSENIYDANTRLAIRIKDSKTDINYFKTNGFTNPSTSTITLSKNSSTATKISNNDLEVALDDSSGCVFTLKNAIGNGKYSLNGQVFDLTTNPSKSTSLSSKIFTGFTDDSISSKVTLGNDNLTSLNTKNIKIPNSDIPDDVNFYTISPGQLSPPLKVEFKVVEHLVEYTSSLKVVDPTGKEITNVSKLSPHSVEISQEELSALSKHPYFSVELTLTTPENKIFTKKVKLLFSSNSSKPKIEVNTNNTRLLENTHLYNEPISSLSFSVTDDSFIGSLKTKTVPGFVTAERLEPLSVGVKSFKYTSDIKGTPSKNIEFKLNKSTFNNFEISTPNNKSLERGKYSLVLLAKDLHGNITEETHNFIVDKFKSLIEVIPNDPNYLYNNDRYYVPNFENDFVFKFKLDHSFVKYSKVKISIGSEDFYVDLPNKDLNNLSLTIPRATFIKLAKENSNSLKFDITPISEDVSNPHSKSFNFIYDSISPEISHKLVGTGNLVGSGSDSINFYSDITAMNIYVRDTNTPIGSSNLITASATNLDNPSESFSVGLTVVNDYLQVDKATIAKLSSGQAYNITILAKDFAGNSSTRNFKFKFDKREPIIRDIKFKPLRDDVTLNKSQNIYYTNGTATAGNLSALNLTYNFADGKDPSTIKTPQTTTVTIQYGDGSKKPNDILSLANFASFDFSLLEDQDITLTINVTKVSGVSTDIPFKFICDKTNPTLKSAFNNSNINIDNSSIFDVNGSLISNFEDLNMVKTNLNLNDVSLPNSLKISNLQVETLNSKVNEFLEISDYSLAQKNNEIVLVDSNNNPINLKDGSYKFTLEGVDLCGNKTSTNFAFISDSKKVNINAEIVYSDINGNIISKKINPLNETIYAPFDATIYVDIEGNISKFKNNKLTIRNTNGDDVTSNLISSNSSIDSSGNISKNKLKKSFSFSLKAEESYSMNLFSEAYNKKSATSKQTVVIDHTNPKVNLNMTGVTGSKNNTLYTNKTNHSINYNVSDKNFDKVTELFVNTQNINSAPNSINGSISNPIHNEGHYNVNIVAKDLSGRTSKSALNLIVDRTAPLITLSNDNLFNDVNGIKYTNKIRPYSYSTSDENGDVADTLKVNGSIHNKFASIAGDGFKDLNISATDIAGNVSNKRFDYILDTKAPVISYKDIESGKYYNKDVLASFFANDENFDKDSLKVLLNGSIYNGQVVKKDGNYVFEATVVDYAGNTSKISIPFIIDTVAPIFNLTGIFPNKLHGGILNPKFTVDDLTATISLFLNGEPYYGGPIIGNGRLTLLALITDKAGNVTRETITFMLDSYSPEIIIEGIENGGVYTSSVIPKIRTERGSKLTILLNGKPYKPGTLSKAGKYTLEIISTDKANNETRQVINFEIIEKKVIGNKVDPTDSNSPISKANSALPLIALFIALGVGFAMKKAYSKNKEIKTEE